MMLPSYYVSVLFALTVVSCTVHHHIYPGTHHVYVHRHSHSGHGGGSGESGSGQADSRQAQSEPANSEPAQSAPADSEPAQSAPADSEPAQSAPADSAPANSVPADSEPVQSEPADSAPADSAPAESEQADSSPAQSGQSSSGQSDSDGQDDSGPEPGDSDVDHLALNIYHGLMNSKVLGKHVHFTFRKPHDLFFRVSTRMLARAGFNDPKVAEVSAHAGQVLDTIPSTLFFRAIGYHLASFLDYAGLVTADTVIPYAYWYVTQVELEACSNGVSDPETVSNAVVYALIDVLEALGLASKQKVTELFHIFADTIQEQAKHRRAELVYEYIQVARVDSE